MPRIAPNIVRPEAGRDETERELNSHDKAGLHRLYIKLRDEYHHTFVHLESAQSATTVLTDLADARLISMGAEEIHNVKDRFMIRVSQLIQSEYNYNNGRKGAHKRMYRDPWTGDEREALYCMAIDITSNKFDRRVHTRINAAEEAASNRLPDPEHEIPEPDRRPEASETQVHEPVDPIPNVRDPALEPIAEGQSGASGLRLVSDSSAQTASQQARVIAVNALAGNIMFINNPLAQIPALLRSRQRIRYENLLGNY